MKEINVRQAIVNKSRQEVSKAFVWRSSERDISPSKMATPHLFYTIRMIWNNRMDIPVPDNPKYYDFPSHSDEYLKEALVHLYRELKTRDDLSDYLQVQLDWMEDHLRKRNITLGQPNESIRTTTKASPTSIGTSNRRFDN